MDLRLNGLNPLSYQGVNAVSPSQFYSRTVRPTINDWQNFILGAVWLYTDQSTTPQTQEVYMLVSLVGNQAKWNLLGSGTVKSVTGGANITISGTATAPIVSVSGATQYAVQVGSAAGALSSLPLGNAGEVLTSQGAGSNAAWVAPITNIPVTNWVPVLTFGNASVGITYSVQTGKYSQIGNVVFFAFQITLTSKGSSTGNAAVTGLPIASIGQFQDYVISTSFVTFASGYLIGQIASGTQAVLLRNNKTAAAIIDLTDAEFANNSVIVCSGSYMV